MQLCIRSRNNTVPLRNKTNRHEKVNDNTSNKSLSGQGTRNPRARNVALVHLRGTDGSEDPLFRLAGGRLLGRPEFFTSTRWRMEEGPGLSLPSAAIKMLRVPQLFPWSPLQPGCVSAFTAWAQSCSTTRTVLVGPGSQAGSPHSCPPGLLGICRAGSIGAQGTKQALKSFAGWEIWTGVGPLSLNYPILHRLLLCLLLR